MTAPNRVVTALGQAARDLAAVRARCALVGGLAVSTRADPRFTRDVDLAVAVADDSEAEAVVAALGARGYAVLAVVEQDALGRLATVRLGLGAGDAADRVVVDLLFASCGIEPEIVAAAEPLEVLPGLRLPVATVGHLLVMKLLARDDRSRPQDLADLRGLLAVATAADLAQAREGCVLLTERGFARGRDLIAALQELLPERLPPS